MLNANQKGVRSIAAHNDHVHEFEVKYSHMAHEHVQWVVYSVVVFVSCERVN